MPKGWFGPKTIGWGASPKRWQGWLATFLFVVVLIVTVRFIVPRLAVHIGIQPHALAGIAAVVEIGLFLALVWGTYDRDA